VKRADPSPMRAGMAFLTYSLYARDSNKDCALPSISVNAKLAVKCRKRPNFV